ncbi:coenzyme F420-0:L-glutamate ligase [Chlamydiifrater phoenicopteri]|uniref:coenzyme F420-0:L-glutamate ligase n=1 Tax=Chlamydiifrater phoenicopteri TaxID=2681469 RepID=UPI001BD14643|nr:coenzyme F420-0:L-glutamate ligase [Chlamydiifrater phoenicopteri]
MFVRAYKTHAVSTSDDLEQVLDAYLPPLEEGSIVAISSKIVSICEGCVVDKNKVPSKEELIRNHADMYLDPLPSCASSPILTKKNNILIPSAGIDESNSLNGYVLYPEDVFSSAIQIWSFLKHRDKINYLGVILTDSHTTLMRKGVLGLALSWCGFDPIYSYIGKPDCYGRALETTEMNIIDALAVSAVFCMGEGNEQTPLAVITEAPKIKFLNSPPSDEERKAFFISEQEDIYAPILASVEWKSRRRSAGITANQQKNLGERI